MLNEKKTIEIDLSNLGLITNGDQSTSGHAGVQLVQKKIYW
jgi:hypothetical protein